MAESLTPTVKSYVGDFVCHLGPISTRGKLYPIRKSDKESKSGTTFHYATPEGKAVKQQYVDDEGNAFTQDELARVADFGGPVVSKEAVAAARKSVLPSNVMNVTVHNKSEVDNELYAGTQNGYILVPDTKDPANVSWYNLLVTVVSQANDKAFLGLVNLRSHEGLLRLGVWRGYLTVQKQLYSSEVNEIAQADIPEIPGTQVKKIMNIINKIERPFVADEYESRIKDRVKALKEAVEAGEVIEVPEPVAVTTIDIDSILDSFEV